MKRVYALYKGDKFLTIGTRQELAKYLNVKERTIQFYSSKTWFKRTNYKSYVVIRIKNSKED